MTGLEVLAVGGFTGMQMVGMATTLASTVMSAMGTIAAGKAQAAQATAAANMEKYRQKQLIARGKWEQAQGRQKADLAKRKKLHVLGRAQVIGSGGGFMFGDHSSSIAIADIERWGSFDEFSQQAMAEGARWDNNNQAAAAGYQAKIHQMEASSAKSSSKVGAMGTLVGGMGNMFASAAKIQSANAASGASGRSIGGSSFYLHG